MKMSIWHITTHFVVEGHIIFQALPCRLEMTVKATNCQPVAPWQSESCSIFLIGDWVCGTVLGWLQALFKESSHVTRAIVVSVHSCLRISLDKFQSQTKPVYKPLDITCVSTDEWPESDPGLSVGSYFEQHFHWFLWKRHDLPRWQQDRVLWTMECASVCLSICLSVSQSVCPSMPVCLFVFLPVCLFDYYLPPSPPPPLSLSLSLSLSLFLPSLFFALALSLSPPFLSLFLSLSSSMLLSTTTH